MTASMGNTRYTVLTRLATFPYVHREPCVARGLIWRQNCYPQVPLV